MDKPPFENVDFASLDPIVERLVDGYHHRTRRFTDPPSDDDKIENLIDALGRTYEDSFSNGYGHSIRGQSMRLKELTILFLDQCIAENAEFGVDIKENYWLLVAGAVLSDIGKLGIDENILVKKGSLNETERTEMEKHPINSHYLIWKVMDRLGFSSKEYLMVAESALHHHERYDGKTEGRFRGYPQGYQGEEISFGGRVSQLMDVAEAVIFGRHYRGEQSYQYMMAELMRSSGIPLDDHSRKVWEDEIRYRHAKRMKNDGEPKFREMIIDRLKEYDMYKEEMDNGLQTSELQERYIERKAQPEKQLDQKMVGIFGRISPQKIYDILQNKEDEVKQLAIADRGKGDTRLF